MKVDNPNQIQNLDEVRAKLVLQTAQPDKTQKSLSLGLLAQVSTLAWNLVIPIVGGVLLGHYLDRRSGSEVTWTLSLLAMGVLISFSNLYNIYIEQGRLDDKHVQTKANDEVAHDQEK